MSIPTLIFDMDDTVMHCGSLYQSTADQVVARISKRTGMPPVDVDDIFHRLNFIGLGMGHRKPMIARAFAATSVVADIFMNSGISDAGREEAFDAGIDLLYNTQYDLIDGVEDVLATFQTAGWQMILYTQGVRPAQLLKIYQADLPTWFGKNLEVVDFKEVSVLHDIVDKYDIDVPNSWMIGDSLRSDIRPATIVGLNTALVTGTRNNAAYSGVDEGIHVEPGEVVPHIAGLIGVVTHPNEGVEDGQNQSAPREEITHV